MYPTRVDVGNTDTYTLAGLSEGSNYYCAVTAYDAARVESDYSTELPVSIPYTPPSVNFSGSPATGTAPLSVAFTNTTTGTVSSWAWDFGDTTTSTAKSPTKVYSTPGSYTVKLTATGPGGTDSMTATTPIGVSAAPPLANFTMTPTSGTAPLSVAFTNSSTGTVASWAWDFGDGTTSTAQNPPAKVYNTAGSYTVKLTATGPGGSNTKTASTPIAVSAPTPPVANFTMTPTSGTTPLVVTLTNTTTGSVTSWAWDFGDGTTSTAQTPTKTYSTAGSYTVKLTATGPGGSNTKTASTPITVNPPAPVANFSMTPTSGAVPLSVAFTDTTTGTVTSWAWDFGDGTTGTGQNPPAKVYNTAGSYMVKLTATGPGGSNTKTASTPISVSGPPVVNFTMTPTSGTTPLAVTFTNTTTGSVTSWAWDFGDGTTSTAKTPTKTYSTAGSYTVNLTATGPGGTVSKTASTPITVNPPAPVANFTASATSGAVPLSVNFTDTTTGTATSWAWDFGDGTTSTARSPSHVYNTAGSYTVKLTANGPGGSNTKTASTPITVSGPPVLIFTPSVTSGNTPLSVAFNNTTTGTVTTWAWDFGDGTTSAIKSPTKTYSTAGSYTVKLTATGPGGTVSKTASTPITVTVPAPVASFTMSPTSGTAPLSVNFTSSSTGNITGYAWDFGDGAGSTSTAPSPTYLYNTTGTRTVKLTVTGPGGSNTKTASITVSAVPAPVANFSMNPTSGTAPLSVQFTSSSTGSITGYAWDFGDGATSSELSPTHVYNAPGSYTARLTVTGPGGSVTKVATTAISVTTGPAPVPNFSMSTTNGTAELPVVFTNLTTGKVDTWTWDFGDGTRDSTAKSPSHLYERPGTYAVSLTATGPGGTRTKTALNPIQVKMPAAPVASFSASTMSGGAPLSVTFSNLTTGKAGTWAWDFGDGASSNERSPTHIYSAPGSYKVSLTATGLGGSSTKTAVNPIKVNPVVANFAISTLSGIAPMAVAFTNLTTGKADTWVWDFGDGTSSAEKSPTHIYSLPGSYTVSLTATGLGGTSTKTALNPIKVSMPAAPVANFSIGTLNGTAPLTVAFTNLTTGKAHTWVWNFGDGGTSNEKSPTHVYTAPGSYMVSLTVTGLGGSSTKTAVNPIKVSDPVAPVAGLSISTFSGTAPLTVAFTNLTTGKADSWVWDFGDGTSSNERSPKHVYTVPGSYRVSLTATGLGGSSTKTALNPIKVSEPVAPVAGLSISTFSGIAPLTVAFTNLTTGKADSWIWDFGDGSSSNERSPKHVYTVPGSYRVSLTATGLGGSSTREALNLIKVSDPLAPVAGFSIGTPSGAAPLTVAFANLTTGKVDTWAWDFGDGTTSTEKSPKHVYVAPGSYTVKLTANGLGGTNTKTALTPIRVVRQGLVAAYGFEEMTGASIQDVSGKGNVGTIAGAARVTTGKFGRALSFNGLNSWATVPDSASLDVSTGMTLEAWVYPSVTMNGWRSIIVKEKMGGDVYCLYANAGAAKPAGGVVTVSESLVQGGSLLPPNTWTHVATTYNGTTQSLYINGVQVATQTSSGPIMASGGMLRIGGNNVWGEFFQGLIDEIRVYNRPLSVAEIQADMNMSVAGVIAAP